MKQTIILSVVLILCTVAICWKIDLLEFKLKQSAGNIVHSQEQMTSDINSRIDSVSSRIDSLSSRMR